MKMLLIVTFGLVVTVCRAQERISPAIAGYGAIYQVPKAIEKPDPSLSYKIVLDLKSGPSSPGEINPALNNIARMFNLHHVGGVTKDKLEVVGVFHNLATPLVISNEAYRKKYGVDNPNIPLITILKEVGVELFVCGQSMISRGFPIEDLNPDIKLSVSALTVFTTYQMRGFNLLQF